MFYGWRIVGLTFFTHFVSVGCLFYSYGVFFRTLQADLGGTSLGVSLGPLCLQLASACSAPFIGAMLSRGSIRRVMMAGALLMGAGFAFAARVSSLFELYLVHATLLGVGSAMLGWLSGSTLVTQWFTRRRGLALGISTVGTTFGGAVMAQVSGLLVEGIGWRGAYLLYGGLIAAVATPAIWLVVVDRPALLGLAPDGLPAVPDVGGRPDPQPGLRRRDVVRSADFWRIALAMGLAFGAGSALLIHIVPLAQDRGLVLPKAAAVLSIATLFGMAGKLVFGWLADRIDVRAAFALCAGLQALGMMLLLGATDAAEIAMAAATFGLGMGGMLPLHASFVGSRYGQVAFGRVLGAMAPAMLPFQVLGIPLGGWLRDATGSYELALQLFMGSLLVAIFVASGIRVRRGAHLGIDPIRADVFVRRPAGEREEREP